MKSGIDTESRRHALEPLGRGVRHKRSESPAAVAGVQRLLTAAGDAHTSPLHTAPSWPAAFQHTGRALADLAAHGQLTRGLRAVLTHHILFTFNRHGISAHDQYLLAAAASKVVFPPTPALDPVTVHPGRSTVNPVTDDTTTSPEQLRHTLADSIKARGTFRTPQVEAAFRAVPRHLFLPDVDLLTAYAPKPVVTKRAGDATAVTSASSPNLVAAMLDQLDVRPGHRVLEIGAATGINAALLAELVGPHGTVVTIELDDDLAAGARQALTTAGYGRVSVICGDGALGHSAAAPYDRIIFTADAWDIVPAWWQQLTADGRLVLPLRLHGSGLTRALGFDRQPDGRMLSATAQVCGFVPLRGAAEHVERHVRLADDVVLKLDAIDLPDEAALTQALYWPAHERWTGIQVHDDEPAEHLDLWLATISDRPFGRLSVGSVARKTGLVNPALRWGGAGVYDGGTMAYIAVRPTGEETNELGLIAHGPDSSTLAASADNLLQHWNSQRPSQPTITAQRATTSNTPNAATARVRRPNTLLTITW